MKFNQINVLCVGVIVKCLLVLVRKVILKIIRMKIVLNVPFNVVLV